MIRLTSMNRLYYGDNLTVLWACAVLKIRDFPDRVRLSFAFSFALGLNFRVY